MIEEVVGVSNFEAKKKDSVTKISKRDLSLEEIEILINESIVPKLNQLKEEEKSLLEFRNLTAELEMHNKIYTAFRYRKDKEIVNNSDAIIQEKNKLINEKNVENDQITEEFNDISDELKILEEKLNAEIGGDLKKLESDWNTQKSDLERINTNKRLKMDNVKEETDKVANLQKSFAKSKKIFEQKGKDFEKLNTKLKELREEHTESEANLKKAEEDFEAVSCGLSKGVDGKEAATFARQVVNAKDELAEIESNINKSKLTIKHNQTELAAKKQKVKSDTVSYENATRDIEVKTKEIKSIESVLEGIDFSEERFENVKQKLSQYKRDSRLLADKLYQLQTEVPGIKFEYKKPYANFDPDDVIGVVGNLFTVNAEEHAVAIEKTCGGRLFNVIVSNEEVGKALINKGQLKGRKTFLPLNKIRGRDTDLKALRVAERLVGKGNVHYAINLVSFDPSLKNAMKHVFGDTLICPNMDMAKKVAFADGVMKRTITYEGEIFDPSGTLTGGSNRSGTPSLMIIAEISSVSEELRRLKLTIQQFEEEFNQLNSLSKQYYEHKSKFDLKKHEIDLLTQRLKESSHYVLMKEIEEAGELLKQEELNIKKFNEEKKEITKRIKDLEDKVKNAEAIKGREREEAQQTLDLSRKQLEKCTKKLQTEEQAFECLTQELKHHGENVSNIEAEINELNANLEIFNQELAALDQDIEKRTEQVAIAEEKYNEYKKILNAKSIDIKKMQSKLDSLKKKLEDNERKVQVTEHEIEKIQLSIKDAASSLKHMLAKNAWIKEEEKDFESTESEYRILQNGFNEEEFLAKMSSIKSKKASLSKRVNLKANTMYGEKQKELDDLIQKKTLTLQNRENLLSCIDNAEKKKYSSLIEAYEKVNYYFGSIFSTLLPNSNAKLSPVKQNSIKEGLEIKVAFGQVWKESLSELSGGQRSLVALSLVLALLKYNPAPLYILDEIDAALDQSHTQNIGIMIKKYFKDAQVCCENLRNLFLIFSPVHYSS